MFRKPPLVVLLGLLVPVALAASRGVARADPKGAAQARMDHATELYREGKFAEALNELTVAYSLDPRPEMLYAIGQMHVQLGNCPQAILFYERFLSTKPDRVPAAAAAEAIETCKKKPNTVAKVEPAPPPTAPPPTAPPPTESPAPPLPAPAAEHPDRWYTDRLGGALLGGGVGLAAAGLGTYLWARSDLDDADAATDYQKHAGHVDDAHTKRVVAVVCGVAGLGLTGAAARRYMLRRRADAQATVGIAPSRGGALITWSGRF
jgi:tetratricopeptide (TPR) repeat protein